MNSVLESMNFGKPMIVVPLFADQQMNSKAVQRRGLGVVIEKHLLSKDVLSAAIQKVLNDNVVIDDYGYILIEFGNIKVADGETYS
ncbi:hypothetical protein TELCIR_06970 [Teladorsagia circumcincta]|uniref:glucuronosyltransferase n=1 Tax=Teladorsagia circumcincta TaxID=45464 RepID=A0A2G9ULK0_TELCI|nr:hypothetical protein TELCIR_06970 [Teladorsagia circumcincta]